MTRIPLYRRGGAIVAYALVDTADAAWASQWTWHLCHGYAARGERGQGRSHTLFLHRTLLGLRRGDGIEGDHKNRDRLDNRRENLRRLPPALNQQNRAGRGRSSQHRGVRWLPRERRWAARVKLGGRGARRYDLGHYHTEWEAARAAACWRAQYMPGAVEDPALLADGPPLRPSGRHLPVPDIA